MTENEIYKSIQKAMEKPPLILVGSGGSAPYCVLLCMHIRRHSSATVRTKHYS